MSVMRLLVCAFLSLVIGQVAHAGDKAADWVEPMKKVHARFKGDKGAFACFGDSITVTLAFWSPLEGEPKNMPADMAKAHAFVKDYMKPDCWRKWKGPAFGNNGSMTIRWAHDNVDTWLKKHNPEVVLIMFGTNDLTQFGVEEYEKKTGEVVDKCLANGSVVILSTIPPFSGRFEKSKEFAEAVRKIAKAKQVPLSDYFAEIVKRRPDDWDGRLAKFKDVKDVYQVPTLISGDGVHPSNPRTFQDYSEESLRSNGYGLRNYLTLIAYGDVIRNVLK